ncbi:hypothetical protein EVG20_g3571 [Dentipellis fragilis]|uniref:Amino acid permease/ SLC12A domain-containing protein n=1 Tax=Dentipellis fragilis TaxID=205917 RepID=A0A4Y9Z1I3_9AGAM|nr:hypothetical protein EVG20_g3571 [Dentipellis fragilis]
MDASAKQQSVPLLPRTGLDRTVDNNYGTIDPQAHFQLHVQYHHGRPEDDLDAPPTPVGALPVPPVDKMTSSLHRGLSSRQVQMIAIAGTIGTGLFLGTGKSLAEGGPASILICYAIIGFIVYVTLLLLGEMATQYPVAAHRLCLEADFGVQSIPDVASSAALEPIPSCCISQRSKLSYHFFPVRDIYCFHACQWHLEISAVDISAAHAQICVLMHWAQSSARSCSFLFSAQHSGSFNAYATRFFSPSYGFALSWNYWFNDAISVASDLTAAQLVLGFWNVPHPWIVSLVLWVFLVAVNSIHVRAYGELEYWLASLKVATIVVFIIIGIIVNAGVNHEHRYIGGSNWRIPGAPFVGGFGGFARVFVTASFAYGGTESLGITAGETKNPTKNMPRVVKFDIALLYPEYPAHRVERSVPNTLFLHQQLTSSRQSPGTTQTSPTRQPPPPPLPSSSKKSAPVRSFPSPFPFPANSILISAPVQPRRRGVLHERSDPNLSHFRREPRALRRDARAVWPRVDIARAAGARDLRMDDAARRAALRAAGHEQHQHPLLRQQLHRQRPAVELAAEPRRRVQPGASIPPPMPLSLIAWLSIGLASWRFRRAWAQQGRPLEEMKFRAGWTWGWGPPFVVITTAALILIQGWSSFAPTFSAVDFVSFYVEIPVMIVMYLLWMLIRKPEPLTIALPSPSLSPSDDGLDKDKKQRVWWYNDNVDGQLVDLRRDEHEEEEVDKSDDEERNRRLAGRFRWGWRLFYWIV